MKHLALAAAAALATSLVAPGLAGAQSLSPDPTDAVFFTPSEGRVAVNFSVAAGERVLAAPPELRASESSPPHAGYRPLCRTPCTLYLTPGARVPLVVPGMGAPLVINAPLVETNIVLPALASDPAPASAYMAPFRTRSGASDASSEDNGQRAAGIVVLSIGGGVAAIGVLVGVVGLIVDAGRAVGSAFSRTSPTRSDGAWADASLASLSIGAGVAVIGGIVLGTAPPRRPRGLQGWNVGVTPGASGGSLSVGAQF